MTGTLCRHLLTGPSSAGLEVVVEGCRDHGWQNILYISNLHWLVGEEAVMSCLGHTWYLAIDMQLFIFCSLPIIWLLWRWEKAGLVVLGLAGLTATAVPLGLAWARDWPFSSMLPGEGQGGPAGMDYMLEFYIVPWCRGQPYCVGLLLGWALHKLRPQPRLHLHPLLCSALWLAALVVGAAVVFGLGGDH